MGKMILLSIFALTLGTTPTFAYDDVSADPAQPGPCQENGQKPCKPDQDKPGQEKPGQEKPGQGGNRRFENFNLVCYYTSPTLTQSTPSTCKVSSVFQKEVTLDGGEVVDNSPEPTLPLSKQIPSLSVECDGTTKYSDHARRFTDLLSTRIQGLSGPKPAIYLGRGALHVGPHVADSYLEIDTSVPLNQQLRLYGQCYVWTGRP